MVLKWLRPSTGRRAPQSTDSKQSLARFKNNGVLEADVKQLPWSSYLPVERAREKGNNEEVSCYLGKSKF